MTSSLDPMRFVADGAERLVGAANDRIDAIRAAAAALPPDRAGVRLRDRPHFSALLDSIGETIAHFTGARPHPVRAILFDKTPGTNWALGWHRDRTICVRERRDVSGFGPWTVKSGLLHVAPPFALLARMVTVRIHLDPVPADNAPLLIAPGSHRIESVSDAGVDAVVAACGVHACLAEAGDIWVYATPILHSSRAAEVPGHRRVLQADYATFDLPGGLLWSGV